MAVDPKVVELELALLRAPTRHDPDFLEAVLDDSMIEFGKSGSEYNKRSVLEALVASKEEPAPDDQLEMTDIRTVELAPEVVLLIYRLKPRKETAIASLRSSVWKRIDGHWRLVFHQGTRATPEGASEDRS
ncbi:DUF4440 domain-containing protein [Mesorhizobium sp. STM 4661]|uniref:nuclear transport factor 2 family protein n=1 Tax=Mesorhizobium sp. STM 4661 TaxID=1297570 RepID=UPI0002BD4854|nr:DUF4440 domain-containing protein [Mesorhizobium sp. STM 4661]CCV14099.1 hypothetical protein MESS4_640074 [Mesorhizobium sp. STM 4661]